MNKYYKCRLCLEESRQTLDIFNDDFSQMIELLTGLKVDPSDGLPSTSCRQCYRDVKTAMLTRYQIINSHKILLEELKSAPLKTPNNNAIYTDNSVKNETPSCSNDNFVNISNNSVESNVKTTENSLTGVDHIVFYSSFNDDFNDISSESYPEFAQVCVKEDPESENNTNESEEGYTESENCSETLGSTDADSLMANAENIIKAVQSNPSSETERTFKKLIEKLQSKDWRAGPPCKQIKSHSDTKKKKKKEKVIQVKKKSVPKKVDGLYRTNINYDLNPEHLEYIKSVGRHARAKCPVCSKEILGGSLKNHLLTHTYDPIPCHLCGKTVKNAHALEEHINYYHRLTADGVVCDECGKCFKMACFLEKHKERQHQGCEKSLECHICGKRFYEKIQLKNHINITHNKIKPFKCEHCGKDFGRRTQFVTHQLVHTKENRYHCQVCGKGFKIKQTLQTHLKGVHGIEEEKTIFCKICQKGFSSAQGLRAHVNSRVHGLEKCEHCSEFITFEYKHIHLKEIHGIEPQNVFS